MTTQISGEHPPIGPGAAAQPGEGGLALFFTIAFAYSWAVGALILVIGAFETPLIYQSLVFLYMFGPAIGALAAVAKHDRGRRIAALGLRIRFNWWLAWAWLIPIGLLAVASCIDWLGPQVSLAAPAAQLEALLEEQGQDPDALGLDLGVMAWIQIVSAFTLAPLINASLMLNEELGWRGFLWDRWRRLGFWRGNIAIGAVWGVWHAPIIVAGHNYPGMPVSGPFLMVVFCIMLAPLIGLVRERGGSVWHAGVFHGTLNSLAGVFLVLLSADTGFPWLSVVGIGGLVAGAAAWALVWALVRARRARTGAAPPAAR